ncbi:unnamed protein product [Sphagnum troendelagicum]|uniref:GTD-binding domain-containing protein n=1 Tax=Sphagnum troendelagicum TaxID=128251 RepID=A0ABP0UQ82_9BRYO
MEVSDNVTGVYGNREELPLQERVDDEIQENEEIELLQALQAEREAQSALYHELEKERNAAATAANEAMAMITRLQEEKAVAQMEARQFQRMVEEKTIYDREAMEILKEVLARREEEKKQLEEEIRICRMKLLLRSAQEEDQRDHQAVPESSNVAVPVLDLSKRSPEAEAELIRKTGSDSAGIKEVVQEKKNIGREPCAAGFWDKEIEEKRLSVLEYVWRFEEQLQQQGAYEPQGVAGDLSRQRHVNLDRLGKPDLLFSLDEDIRDRNEMEYVSDDFTVPLYEAGSSGTDMQWEELHWRAWKGDPCTHSEISRHQAWMSIEDEVQQLTLRLKALEADRHLMKQTINSLTQEYGGMKLLQEIAQQLRELRGMELEGLQQQNSLSDASSVQVCHIMVGQCMVKKRRFNGRPRGSSCRLGMPASHLRPSTSKLHYSSA